jgi:uncharacterized delta-60 repeat protein
VDKGSFDFLIMIVYNLFNMRKYILNKKSLLIILSILLFFSLFYSFFFKSTEAQVCLPLSGYLVWPGTWESGWIPMASTTQYVLTRSPIYVSGSNVGIGTLSPVYNFQVNGTIYGQTICLGNPPECRTSWPTGGGSGDISGSGYQGQIAFWTSSSTISGSNNLFWSSSTNRLGIGTTTPQAELHVVGNIIANNLLARINASYVSSGQFGYFTGGGNYSFPENLGINVTTTDINAKLHIKNVDVNVKDFLVESTAMINSIIRAIGGTNGDYAYSIQQTSDGGYIVAGETNSFGAGGADFLIIKLDSLGNIQWSRAIGGTNNDQAYSIQKTSDGGYIVAGRTNSFGAGNYDAFIIKLNSSGNIQWSRVIGGTNYDEANSIQQTSDGGYIVAGWTTSFGTSSDALIIKLNSSGNIQWSRAIGRIGIGTGYDIARSIQQTSDGGYIVAGETYSFSFALDVFIIKLDSSGNIQWSRAIGGTNNDGAYSIQQTSDGGYIVAGYTILGASDALIIKLDSSGNIQWSRAIGGINNELAYFIKQTSDGGYIVAGNTNSFGTAGDALIIKLNSSGNIQWSRAIGGTNGEEARSIQQTSDGGYIVAGWTNSFGTGSYDSLIIKLDSSGNISGCGNVLNVSPTNNSISPTNNSISTTNNSISPTNNSISPTNNSISPTVSNVCYGLSPIFEISSGKINIGYNILDPKAFLNISGSVQIGHGGTPIRKIQHGIIGTCSSDGSAGSSGVVNFPYAFSNIPLIFFMPSEEFNNSGCNTVRINSRSTTGFSWSSWSGTTQTACDCIYWMAIEP